MKFKFFLSVICLSLTISVISLLGDEQMSNNGILQLDIEVLAASECISSSAGNEGRCEALVDGTGDVCVVASWYERKNCVKHVEY